METAAPRLCRQCQMEIPVAARRCGHCSTRLNEFRNEVVIAAVLAVIILGFVVVNLVGR